jgi:hypothetical protein
VTSPLVPRGLPMVDPSGQRVYVPIPKNASTSIVEALRVEGWRHAQLPDPSFDIKEMIIVLRDPIQRWISGMSQYIRTSILSPIGPNGPVMAQNLGTAHDYHMEILQFQEQYTDLVERIIYSQCDRFDDHVWPQSSFLPDLPTAQRRYIIMDQDFEQKTKDILQINMLHLNDRDQEWRLKKLQQWFGQRLLLRPELEQRIRDRYQRDYDLIKEAHGH